ncbi:GNAT family N-acetyltransferase [Streptomyces sp. NPDC047315]|uniref:GNAT family N-acetyltransferase n=1 Tax=Streptomyces sp. NPDC047315 TaxID=3155142 RepID=UPI0033F17A0B
MTSSTLPSPRPGDLDVRKIDPASEYPDWLRAVGVGFQHSPSLADGEVEGRTEGVDLSRAVGAFDRGRIVATYRTFEQYLTVVGGAAVRSNAVTNVTVTSTHRRRGLLSRMMGEDLAAAKERGDALSTLISAEYPIYGRFGYGPATWVTEWAVNVARAGVDRRWSGPTDGGRIDLVPVEEVRKIGPELHARFAAGQPGAVSRNERWWRMNTGEIRVPSQPWTEPYYVVYRSASGEVEGLASYANDRKWDEGKQPDNTVTVEDLIAVTPAAERALWQYLCSLDWVTTLRTGRRAPDDLLPLLLADPRAARTVAHADFLWVRLLDVARALEARTYDTSATLVLDVRDAAGLANGRFRLEVAPDGASCVPSTGSPDLTLDVRELGACYLGDASVVQRAALGTVQEERAGAAALADRVFRTARRPWCPDVF